MKKTSYIDKRTLNPFFKKTNSTPQDLLDWVEFLMKEYSDIEYPCVYNKKRFYMGKYRIYGQFWVDTYERIRLMCKKDKYSGLVLWHNYVMGDKQPLLDAIKEFKEKYKL